MYAEVPSRDQEGSSHRRANPPKWRYVYFVLAAFDLMTVSAGLYLNHRIMGIYTRSVEVNRVWAERVAAYSHLGELATDVDTPGNDVFDNRDVAREFAQMRAAEKVFDLDLAQRRREIENNLDSHVAAPLLALLEAIARAKTDMVVEAERIFEHFRDGRPDLAGQRMATMDHKYANLNAALLKLRNTVGAIQEQNFNEQMAAAAEIQRYEYLIGMSIVLMVLGATFYGHKLAQQMQLDADERAQHFKALQEAEARTRSILETAAEGIVTFDQRGRIESFNRAAERLFGYEAGEAIGREISAMIPALAQHLGAKRLNEVAASNAAAHCVLGGQCIGDSRSCKPLGLNQAGPCMLRGESAGQRRDGTQFPLELSVSRHNIGSAAIFTGIVRDMSDRHKAEEALRVAAIAQAANRAKSQFLANMSHEIRTPMNGVLGMSEMLLDSELTSTQRRLAETVHRSGESLLEIIDRILDFSKIEAGKLELESIDFNPRDVTEEVTQLMAESAEKKGLVLFCRVNEDVPHALRGAPFRLRQVLTNLLANAIKFTDMGEVRIDVSRLDDAEGGSMRAGASSFPGATVLRFAVTDTGIGIAESVRERLFQPFMQADSSTTRRYGGTGLGLAISRELVERMGGAIGVRSTPGEGSEFWFTVRLDPPLVPVSAPASGAGELSGRRVLIIADNPANCRMVEEHLRAVNVDVQCCQEGRHGLDLLRSAAQSRNSFDLAIVDYRLPDSGALEFARAVQAEPAISMVALVMLTPARLDSKMPDMREAGFLARITTRMRQSDVYDRVAEALAARDTDYDEQRQSSAASALTGVRVLLAEDNPINQDVTRTMLRSLGCQVCVVDTGTKVLAKLQESPFDIVLMDRQMPEMDGFEATAQIRARRLLRPWQPPGAVDPVRLPIIGLTASALKGDREICIAAGMDDYLAKPFRRDALRLMLFQWVLDRSTGHLDAVRARL